MRQEGIEGDYDKELIKLFSESGKCTSSPNCIGNSYLIESCEFIAPDRKKYCSERCYRKHKEQHL